MMGGVRSYFLIRLLMGKRDDIVLKGFPFICFCKVISPCSLFAFHEFPLR